MFVHLAQAAFEAAKVMRGASRGDLARIIDDASRAVLDAALAEGRGVVAVGGHIGHWELLGLALSAAYPTTAVAKPLYDPRLTAWATRLRTQHGMELCARGEPDVFERLRHALRRGRIVGLLLDQDTKVPGTLVPFFGRPAHTPTAAATLALAEQAPVVVGWLWRAPGQGARWQCHFERVRFAPTGERKADEQALTALVTWHLEQVIRQRPEQWVWLHRRWRTTPPFRLAEDLSAHTGSDRLSTV
jgi:KDO2-lipid IV(A) lauroyltransferase